MRSVSIELFAFAAESGGVNAVHCMETDMGWHARVYDANGRQYVLDKFWPSQEALEDELRESFDGSISVY